jgi:Fuc2NAc and GlcNAc transferase
MISIFPGWPVVYSWVAVAAFAAVMGFIASLKATALAENFGMIAQPGERQSHTRATPTGGGLGLMISIVVTSIALELLLPVPAFWWQNMLPGILILVFIGWLDDRKPVSALLRLLVQLAVSFWLIGYGWLQFSPGHAGLAVVALVAMVWLMNLYNFMDGSNGMAGFQGVFAGMVTAALLQMNGQGEMALLALSVAAACAGFLPLNYPRARVFMGDVASVPLGFIFASFFIYGVWVDALTPAVSILIMSVFITDASLTLLARAFRGERWYTAHAQHVYQRLIAHGWSHSRVLLLYQAINVIVVLPAIVLAQQYPRYAFVTAGVVLSGLGVCWYFANRRLGTMATVQFR